MEPRSLDRRSRAVLRPPQRRPRAITCRQRRSRLDPYPRGVFRRLRHKAAFGRVPAYPLRRSALANIGPMARNVDDAALMLLNIGRPDARDPMAWTRRARIYLNWPRPRRRGNAHRLSPKLGLSPCPSRHRLGCEKAAQTFVELGANVEVADPKLPDCRAIIDTLWEAGRYFHQKRHPRRSTHAHAIAAVLRDAEMGAKVPTGRYIAASAGRADVALAMARFTRTTISCSHRKCRCRQLPAGHDVPPGSEMDHWIDWSPFSYPFNITQQPAASVPCGFTRDRFADRLADRRSVA